MWSLREGVGSQLSYYILEVNKWLFSYSMRKMLWSMFRIRRKADGHFKCLPHVAVSSTVTLAHGGGDGLFFMVDVMGQYLSEHWRTSGNACLSLCCSRCLYQQGVTVIRYGVLAFQAWQTFRPNWLIYPYWRRNTCALFIGRYWPSSSESGSPVQTSISFQVTVERYLLMKPFSLHLVRWTSLCCIVMSD